jgi:hypothetical protein
LAVSLLVEPGVRYPGPEDSYSPGERYPEYAFDQLSSQPNEAYDLVRRTLLQLELDKVRIGTPDWNPLGGLIPRGSRVFVLCNFVYHRRPRESPATFAGKCIHGSVLRALCDYILIAIGPGGRIRFGNSALQSCEWDRVLADTGASVVADFYRARGAPVSAQDLRLFVAERSPLGHVRAVDERDERDGVEIAMGEESLLAELAGSGGPAARFRIADYKPERIEAFHSGDRHRYVIHRAVLESDVVFSLSKLKTHEKVGITCGLKGFVGIVGHKDCLAHHRFGSTAAGGDEYPARQRFLQPVSHFQDWVNGRDVGAPLERPVQVVDRLLRRALRRLGTHMGGAWYGNDTAWRMSLDLGRIAHYADADGRMHSTPQRRHLSLIDGIVAGEGDGPLDPTPLDAGTLIFSDDVADGDAVACRAMGFDPERIPIVREAFRRMEHPLVPVDREMSDVIVNGRRVALESVESVAARRFRAPSGWRSHLERGPT